MALPYGTTRSLRPAFAPARDVSLAAKPPYAFALDGWFPLSLRGPSCASVAPGEATALVKLRTMQCPSVGYRSQARRQERHGWCCKDCSTEASAQALQPPTYP